MCGGTLDTPRIDGNRPGLSPRVRGNPRRFSDDAYAPRSIPACAGEPSRGRSARRSRAVYPRVCGGTRRARRAAWAWKGLSPRVRGNPTAGARFPTPDGSIPACAGEPTPGTVSVLHAGVYPRVCGGTECVVTAKPFRYGLSPRVRGNHLQAESQGRAPWSIPACAGEPRLSYFDSSISGVYPRVCGGTPRTARPAAARPGLSPRVRGNPAQPADGAAPERSIPACAGEPAPTTGGTCPAKVYPRVCGGTAPRPPQSGPAQGLSPRVRGNQPLSERAFLCAGSIPACAGEPARSAFCVAVMAVYPRVCGGTSSGFVVQAISAGLSPRVRGNRR